jgi:DNA-binding transcriptional regulator YdaS (Cro superfamily)
MMNTTKTATARLATLGRVTRCEVRRAGDWYVVDAMVCRGGFMQSVHATAATLDAALKHVGC